MDDDGSWVIESLDSLWFFSNVLSSSSSPTAATQFLSFPANETPPTEPIKEAVLQEPSKPISQMLLQIQDNHTHHESPRCSKCGDLAAAAAAEIELEMWNPIINMEEDMVVESSKYWKWTAAPKEETRKKRRKRCKKTMKQRRKILGELDLCSDGKQVWMLDGNCGGGYCNGSFGSAEFCKYNYKMPPFHDNMAMKEHLKYWAYAVACTVR
ncbi:uncharacterized protein LOC132803066 [Ziziphus jujuba]|uniref:Uncharacterized protein LOC132803066 n=1 Tax=Ziziphus jujuba TaxID=326968 RepID=A0ABM4A3E5_ZIZJJ|nr:uncharacterized protein LOC132803066 [Ziziphus jujuba]